MRKEFSIRYFLMLTQLKTLVCLWTCHLKTQVSKRCLFYNIRWSFGKDSSTDSATLLVCNLLLDSTLNMFRRPQFKVQKFLFACVTWFTTTEKINQLPGENKLKASSRVDCRNTPVPDSSVKQGRFVAVTLGAQKRLKNVKENCFDRSEKETGES